VTANGAAPLVIGIGGTTRPNSTSERTLAKALDAVAAQGCRTKLFGGVLLSSIPIYDPATAASSPGLQELLEGVRQADGVIIASPGYHGSVSGVIKNALDALEDLRSDARPYFEGRAVGCIITADGWQACGTALSSLRTIVHALRGWPTPLGLAFNPSASPLFGDGGDFRDERDGRLITMLADQVVEFARDHGRQSRTG